jgi:MFS family permease
LRERDGYRAVLADQPVRYILGASLAGRIGFLMLPLGLILLAGSAATAGALVAAFSVASALAPVRGRIVDRHGARALATFALACAVATWALVFASAAVDSPPVVIVALGAVVGLVVPPLGPFTRAALGSALRERGERLQRAYGLDSAGEESALIFAPLLVAVAAGLFSPAIALTIAAAVMLVGTVAAARTPLAATARPAEANARGPLPAALWLLYGGLAGTAAALGAIEIAVPAAAREQEHTNAAGFLLAAMAVGTVAGSLTAGRRRWHVALQWRVVALSGAMAVPIAVAAMVAGRLELLGAALIATGAALGALFASVYVLADRLAPSGSGTRAFAWLVTANNGGLALGAGAAGALVEGSGPSTGLWFGAACALAALLPATAAARVSARVLNRAPFAGVS